MYGSMHPLVIAAPGSYVVADLHWPCEFRRAPALLYLEGLDSLMSSTSSGSYILSAISSAEFSYSWREVFNWDKTFRAESSKLSHCLHIVCMGLCIVLICSRRKLLRWWLIIYLWAWQDVLRNYLLLPVSKMAVFSFPRGPWPSQSQVPGHSSSIRYGFHLMEWALTKIRYWLFSATSFVQLLHQCIWQTGLVAQRVYRWVVFTFLLWQYANYHPVLWTLVSRGKGSRQMPAQLLHVHWIMNYRNLQ